MIAAVRTGFGGDDLLIGIEINPDMFEFVKVLNLPIPPDGIFDGAYGVRGQCHVTRERWGRGALTKDGITDDGRQKWFFHVETDARRMTDGEIVIALVKNGAI